MNAGAIQGKNEFFYVLNFKGFYLTKKKKKATKRRQEHELWIEKEDKL